MSRAAKNISKLRRLSKGLVLEMDTNFHYYLDLGKIHVNYPVSELMNLSRALNLADQIWLVPLKIVFNFSRCKLALN